MGLLSAGDIARMRGTLDQLANAALTMIEKPATIDDSGDPATWTTLWSGSAPAYIARVQVESITKSSSPGQARAPVEIEAPVSTDVLTLLDGVATVIAAAGPVWSGHRVTITDSRTGSPVTMVRSVVEAEHQAYGLLDSARVVLDPSGA